MKFFKLGKNLSNWSVIHHHNLRRQNIIMISSYLSCGPAHDGQDNRSENSQRVEQYMLGKKDWHTDREELCYDKLILGHIPPPDKDPQGSDLRIRPIVASRGTPTEKITWLVTRIFSPFLRRIPTHMPDSDSFITALTTTAPQTLRTHRHQCSLDVESSIHPSLSMRPWRLFAANWRANTMYRAHSKSKMWLPF